eukprot:04993.XXX_105064_105225_1 [CDS] Oithona nana genome sequencing.
MILVQLLIWIWILPLVNAGSQASQLRPAASNLRWAEAAGQTLSGLIFLETNHS